MIKLYGVPGSRAARCLWMLEELGLEYENVPVHFATGETQKPEYLALNPNGRIPTLDDEGFVIWESMAINLYLARRYGGGLWPASDRDQALAVQWSFWGMTEIEPPLMDILMNRAFLPEDQRDATVAAASEERLERPLAALERALEGRDHLVGASFTVADLNVASILSWGPLFGGQDLSPYPRVKTWLQACSGRPALARLRT